MTGRVVIAGGGEAGAHTALALRRRGFGGRITLISGEDCLPYERPPLSKETILSAGTVTPRTILGQDRLAELDITFRSGVAVESIDLAERRLWLGDGSDCVFDRLVIATGARPRRPRGLAEHPRIRVLRSFQDALAIRAMAMPGSRIVVIGGGFIGLELAAVCRQRGCEVDLVESASRLLGRVLPEGIAAHIASVHRQAGVRLHLGAQAQHISAHDGSIEIALPSGKHLEADMLIVGIGIDPETRLAERAGLAIDNGVAVNSRLECSDPAILAAGDCCSFPHPLYEDRRIRLESWRNAQRQADTVARNILGEGVTFDAVPWFWSDQYGWNLQVAGLPTDGVRTIQRDLSATDRIWFHLNTEGRVVGATGLGQGPGVAREIRLTEALIARRARPEPNSLQDRDQSLKSLVPA